MNRRDVMKYGSGLAASATIAGCLGGGGSGYPSDAITWIIPYGTGGGFDAYSRAVTEFMPSHLPNEVDVVAQNKSGAGGSIGANAIYNADPDGYTMGIFNIPGFVAAQIVTDTEYDLREVTWFGIVASPTYMLATAADSEYETLDDVINADEVKWGDTGFSSSAGLNSLVISSTLDLNTKWVMGYSGSAETLTALLRGDIDLFLRSPDVFRTPYQDDEIRILASFAEEPPEYAPETPLASEMGHDSIAVMGLNRMVGGPPDIDDEIASTVESALLDTLKSDNMQEWSEKNGRPISPGDSKKAADIIERDFQNYQQYADLLSEKLG